MMSDATRDLARNPGFMARKEAIREKLATFYETVVDDVAEATNYRIAAADKLWDRIDGKPAQMNLNVNSNEVSSLTDDELRSEIARLRREAGFDAAGAGEAAGGTED